eukprot:COSAG01_NODE_1061_length_11887_cov_151.517557_14_plen_96_part_00
MWSWSWVNDGGGGDDDKATSVSLSHPVNEELGVRFTCFYPVQKHGSLEDLRASAHTDIVDSNRHVYLHTPARRHTHGSDDIRLLCWQRVPGITPC